MTSSFSNFSQVSGLAKHRMQLFAASKFIFSNRNSLTSAVKIYSLNFSNEFFNNTPSSLAI